MVRANGGKSVWLKRMVVLSGTVGVMVVGLTALDKRDERTCRQDPTLLAWSRYDPPAPVSDGLVPVPAGPVLPALSLRDVCDGFLPW